MRKFDPESKCPKCGEGNASTRWFRAGSYYGCVPQEHLWRECQRCGFGWSEAPVDAKEQAQ